MFIGKVKIYQIPKDILHFGGYNLVSVRVKGTGIDAADVMISADVDRLDQVFANLISNAIRYTKPGGSITMSSELADNRIGDIGIKE